MASRTSYEHSRALAAATALLVSGMIFFLCGCVLLWFSYLRETREFWLNAGGYPIVLRDIVHILYYPMLIFTAAGLLILTALLCFRMKMPEGFTWFGVLVVTSCWLLVFGSIGISLFNNVENLKNGRPISYKPPLERR